MLGKYVSGIGKAHKRCVVHQEVFNTKMFGTFNVYVSGLDITRNTPSIVLPTKKYWFVSLAIGKTVKYGWAIRDNHSKQRVNTLEILTKELLPEAFKTNPLDVTVFNKWDIKTAKKWAKDKYWFQTFPFSPKRADSDLLWNTIKLHADWSGKTVLDYGCHYGFLSFEAAKEGAIVQGVDKNSGSLTMAGIIRDSIIQQDVQFSNISDSSIWDHPFDIICYMSVHHQIDPEYVTLKTSIEYFKRIAQKFLFIELIMPPMFPKNNTLTKEQIDKIVGGEILVTYKHAVRGERTIYKVTI